MVGVFVQLNRDSRMAKGCPLGYVIGGGGCWEWVGSQTSDGYGQWRAFGEHVAHRAVYRLLRGAIPEGLTLDHLCRNTGCVNPDHLEPVTIRENLLRGEGACAKNARKTHCLRGHPFNTDNTYLRKGGGRRCRTCDRTGMPD